MSNEEFIDLFKDEEEKISKASRITGIVVGIVTSNKDEENLGRIQVTFPWHSDENESDWIRVCGFLGGNDRGSHFVPEVGEEVICGFIHGDINRPVCLGILHGMEDKPPAKNEDGKNNIKMIKTKSGHTITLNDEKMKERISVESKSGHAIIMDDSLGQEKITIKDKTGKNFIEFDSIKNSISIKSNLNLELKAPNITIEATAMMNIKSQSMLKIQGLPIMLN